MRKTTNHSRRKKRRTQSRTKRPTITQQKKKLWKYISLYVRNRDGFRCYTCGKFAMGSAMHAGHFVPSSQCNLAMRYDPEWLRAQCYNCNINLSGNYVTFRENLIKDRGEDAVVAWEQRRHEIVKDYNYEEKIEEAKALCQSIGLDV